MKFYETDLEAASEFARRRLSGFVYLDEAQRSLVRARAKRWVAWRKAHPWLHDAVGVGVLVWLFSADLLALFALPLALPFSRAGAAGAVAAGAVAGLVHGAIVCSIVTYSVHEGAAHDLIVVGRGRVARVARALANNACRLFLADPEYYAAGHFAHHRDFGTRDDASFTSHVRPRRLFVALAPLAPLLSVSDYFPWRPQEQTASRRRSRRMTDGYLLVLFVGVSLAHGPVFAAVALLLVGAWVSYALDRLRESTEHVFLPLDRYNGTRDFGLDPWGLLFGGGPWGQPCHFAHHLEPALAWYQQIALHVYLRRLLTPAQRRQFFLTPLVGYPRLLARLLTQKSDARGAP